MKRYGNLKQYWCTYDALVKAFGEVKKNKSFHHNLLQYESNLVVNLQNLLKRLEDGTYQPQKPREFYVHEPKKRLIHAPQLEDRIVHHALLNVVREKIENRFVHHSFACRKERGTHKASDIVKQWLIEYKDEGYYLKIDISKFFYSIDHSILEKQIRKIIKCEETVQLLKKFYANEEGKGLPLGNVTSQVLANLALNPVDHFIKREIKAKHFIRYMDDLLIIHKSREFLKQALKKILKVVYSLTLKINSKTKIARIRGGIDFVGYKTWYNRRVIRKRTLYNIKRKLKKEVNLARVASFLSHSKRTDSIVYVVRRIKEVAKSFIEFIKNWITNNRGDKLNEVYQT